MSSFIYAVFFCVPYRKSIRPHNAHRRGEVSLGTHYVIAVAYQRLRFNYCLCPKSVGFMDQTA